MSSIHKRLFCSSIKKCNKILQDVSKEVSQCEKVLSKQLSTIDFYIFSRSITSCNKKSLQKSVNIPQKKLSSLKRSCSLPTFIANETITNLTQYELSQEESSIFKAGLHFSIQPDKLRKSKIHYLLKSFIVHLSITLNPRELEVR